MMDNPNTPQGSNGANGAPQNNGAAQPQGMPPQGQPQGYAPGQQPPQGYGPQPPQGYGPGQPQGYGPQQPMPGVQGKSSVAAGLLGIFLGWTGAHCFYLGYKQLAIIHLALGGFGFLLSILGVILPLVMISGGSLSGAVGATMLMPLMSGAGSLLVAGSGIWGLVEGIMCFSKSGKFARDANGVPLA